MSSFSLHFPATLIGLHFAPMEALTKGSIFNGRNNSCNCITRVSDQLAESWHLTMFAVVTRSSGRQAHCLDHMPLIVTATLVDRVNITLLF